MPTVAYDPRVHGGEEFPGWSVLLHPEDAETVRASWEALHGDKAQKVWDATRHFQTTPDIAERLWPFRQSFEKWVAVDRRRETWVAEHDDTLSEVAETLRVQLWMTSPDARELIRDAATLLLEETDLFNGPGPDAASVAPLVTAKALEASNRPSLAAAATQAGKAAATVARRGWYAAVRSGWNLPQQLSQDDGLAVLHEWVDRRVPQNEAAPWLLAGVATPAGRDLLTQTMKVETAYSLSDPDTWAEAHRLLTDAGLRSLRYPAEPDAGSERQPF